MPYILGAQREAAYDPLKGFQEEVRPELTLKRWEVSKKGMGILRTSLGSDSLG